MFGLVCLIAFVRPYFPFTARELSVIQAHTQGRSRRSNGMNAKMPLISFCETNWDCILPLVCCDGVFFNFFIKHFFHS